MRCFIPVLLVFLTISGYAQRGYPATVDSFVRYFDSTDYRSIFMSSAHEDQMLWNMDSSRSVLIQIVESDSINTRAQFFAAQVLFENDTAWNPQGELRLKVARIYATALKENYTLMGNPWGLPEDNGDIGKNIDTLGYAIVKAFRPLLHNRTRVWYAGSKTATMGHIYKYRVKDVAAAHICETLHIRFYGGVKPWLRSVQIAWLRVRLLWRHQPKKRELE